MAATPSTMLELGTAAPNFALSDVVSGNNTLSIEGQVYVRGFTTAKGFDVASGWGTVRANTFAPALASATQAAHQNTAVRAAAAAALSKLVHQGKLSRSQVGSGGTTLLTAPDFLPGHPVTVYIDGRKIVTLHAGTYGSVSHVIKPSALGLSPGRHVVDLVSMLITTTNTFR